MYEDQFAPAKTYKKTSQPGNTGFYAQSGPKKKGPGIDAQGRKLIEIENDSEHYDVVRTDLSIANRMRTLRAAKEWSQKDLAHAASVKIDVVRDYESNKAIPDPKTIKKLEQALGGPLRDPPAKKK